MTAQSGSARAIALAIGLLMSATAVGLVVRSAGGFHAAPLPPARGPLPDFLLMDHQRRPISRASLQGSVWIAGFIFTRCAGQCPLISAQMARLQGALRGVAGVRLVSFSVDPDYDTPERLTAYAARYGADAERWSFVTGDPAALTSLIRDGFHLGIGADGSAEEPITHSVKLVLVDQRGAIRGYYDTAEPSALARLRADARRLARER